jgi:hypothetical protein
MIFSLSDIWYVTLAKVLILCWAVAIIGKIINQSLWNCTERGTILSSSLRRREYQLICRNSFAVLVNIFFIWVMVQGLVLLFFGYISVSPKVLIDWRFQEISLFGVFILLWQYYRHKRRLK